MERRSFLSLSIFCYSILLVTNLVAQVGIAPPSGEPRLPANVRGFRRQWVLAQHRNADWKRISTHSGKPQTSDLDFAPAIAYNSGGFYADSVAIADVNGDGKPDLVVASSCENNACEGGNGQVAVLLGNGDGTFQAAMIFDSGGYYADSIAVADVNGDGKPDLIVANECVSYSGCEQGLGGVVGVLLGNGDGTFQPAAAYGSGGYNAYSVVVGDVNGDGKADLVVANNCADAFCDSSPGGSVGILLGNGDGTFQTAVNYSSGGNDATSVALSDVNGDGSLDIVVTNSGSSSLGVLLGNGDGSFKTAITYASGGPGSDSVAVVDLNGDHRPDLIVGTTCVGSGTCTNGAVGVLMGNGDGTFQTAVTYPSGGQTVNAIAVADVNGDGKPDLVVANCAGINMCGSGDGAVQVLPGNGDGTFQIGSIYDTGGSDATSVAVADLNGDDKPDLAVTNLVCNGIHCTGGSVGILINSSVSASSTTIMSSLNPSAFGQSVTYSATVTSQGFKGTPTGTVTFTDNAATLGVVASMANGVASLSTTLVAGHHNIVASYGGDANFEPSVSLPLAQTVDPASTTTFLISSANPIAPNQTVTYTATVDGQYGGVTTGTVGFKDGNMTTIIPVTSGQAVLTKSYSTPGPHPVTASYSGDNDNAGSTSGTLTEYVEKLPVASKTAVSTSGSPSLINQPVTFTATLSSNYGLIPDDEVVTFFDGAAAIGTGFTAHQVATFSTSSLTAKTHVIKATYSGDATFKTSSGTVKQVVGFYPSTTALTSSPSPAILGQSVTLTATVRSSAPGDAIGTVTFKNGATKLGMATLQGNTAILTTTRLPIGTLTIAASYGGDSRNGKSSGTTLTIVEQSPADR